MKCLGIKNAQHPKTLSIKIRVNSIKSISRFPLRSHRFLKSSIYLSSHAGTILGWALPEARLLLRDLTEHATQREFVYSHQWQANDLVMWDNRQTMHRVRRYDESLPRDMRRTTVAGDAPTVAQAA